MTKKEYKEFSEKYYPDAERLCKIGLYPFSFDPGMVCKTGSGRFVDLPQILVDIICDLIKKVYPETVNDTKMLRAYKRRQKRVANAVAKSKKSKNS